MRESERLNLQAEVFGSLFLLTQQMARRADARMEPVELTTKQWLLLAILVKRFPGQTPTLSEAAQIHGSSRQNVKQIALQLESRGYLRLVSDSRDRRALRMQLTDKVAVLDAPIERQRQADLMRELFVGLADPELVRLHELVLRCLGALGPMAPSEE